MAAKFGLELLKPLPCNCKFWAVVMGIDLGLIPVMPELKALSHGRRFLPFAALLDPPAA